MLVPKILEVVQGVCGQKAGSFNVGLSLFYAGCRRVLCRINCPEHVYRVSIRFLLLTRDKNNGCTCLKEPGIRGYSNNEMILLRNKVIILFMR